MCLLIGKYLLGFLSIYPDKYFPTIKQFEFAADTFSGLFLVLPLVLKN